jgi:hypothetical protein
MTLSLGGAIALLAESMHPWGLPLIPLGFWALALPFWAQSIWMMLNNRGVETRDP